jgi:hypothetical protein
MRQYSSNILIIPTITTPPACGIAEPDGLILIAESCLNTDVVIHEFGHIMDRFALDDLDLGFVYSASPTYAPLCLLIHTVDELTCTSTDSKRLLRRTHTLLQITPIQTFSRTLLSSPSTLSWTALSAAVSRGISTPRIRLGSIVSFNNGSLLSDLESGPEIVIRKWKVLNLSSKAMVIWLLEPLLVRGSEEL